MRTEQKLLIALGLTLAACGNANPGVDAPTPDVPAIDAPVAMARNCPAPVPNPREGLVFGTSVGSQFAGFTLPQCDGTDYTFYDDANCSEDYSLTVVSIAAIWCVPCQQESRQLTDSVTNVYADRGVRVIQIIVDGRVPGTAFTPAECQSWVDTYGLINPELMDHGGEVTNGFFPDGSLPSTLVIDRNGIIRFRENGASMGLVTLTAAIERELTAAGR